MKENVTVKAMERDSKWMLCHLVLLFLTLPLATIRGENRKKKLLLENLLKVLGGIIVGGVFSGLLLFFG